MTEFRIGDEVKHEISKETGKVITVGYTCLIINKEEDERKDRRALWEKRYCRLLWQGIDFKEEAEKVWQREVLPKLVWVLARDQREPLGKKAAIIVKGKITHCRFNYNPDGDVTEVEVCYQ